MTDSNTTKGASDNERLIAAAREDNEELLLEIFEKADFDINYQDVLGNTALHHAAAGACTDVLEHILAHDECDVDPINRLERATPLHLAIRIPDPELRKHIVESLLDAGADTTIKDKNGDTVLDLALRSDPELARLIRKARAQAAVAQEEVASEDEGEPDSGSEEEE